MSSSRPMGFLVLRLNRLTSREEIFNYFKKFGPVIHVSLFMDIDKGLSKGTAKVVMKTQEGFETAIAQESHIIDQQEVFVKTLEN